MTEDNLKNHDTIKKVEHYYKHKVHRIVKKITSLILQSLMFAGVFVVLLKFVPGLVNFIYPVTEELKNMRDSFSNLKNQVSTVEEQVAKIATLETQISNHRDQLTNLETKLEDLSKTNEDLNRKVSQIKLADGSHATEQAKQIWQVIVNNYQKGQPFDEELHSLIPHIGSYKEAIDAAHKLGVLAKEPAKTADELGNELQEIYTHIEKGGSHLVAPPTTWLGKFWNKLKSIVQIRKSNEHTVDTKMSTSSNVIDAIKSAMNLIQKKDLKSAVEALQHHTSSVKPLLDQWMLDAQKRLDLDSSFEKLHALMDAYTK